MMSELSKLAKAALYAGIRLLMEHLKVKIIDRIRLARGISAVTLT